MDGPAGKSLALEGVSNGAPRSVHQGREVAGLAIDRALLDLVPALKVGRMGMGRVLDGKHAAGFEGAQDVLNLLLKREVGLMLGDEMGEGEVEGVVWKLRRINPARGDVFHAFKRRLRDIENRDIASEGDKLAGVAAKANANVEDTKAGLEAVAHAKALPDFLSRRSREPISVVGLVGDIPPVFDNG